MMKAPLTAESREAVLQAEQGNAEQHCLVCYSPLDCVAKTPCDHNEICGVCHLRLRYLHQDVKCPICKASNTQIIVDRREATEHPRFDDYPVWGDSLGDGFVYRADVGMFIETRYFTAEVEPLFGYRCGIQGCDYDGIEPDVNIFASSRKASANQPADESQPGGDEANTMKPTSSPAIRSLQDHLRVKHRMALCGLCVDHQRDFVSRLPRFTPTELSQHLKTGGKVMGEQGHPLCEFCRPTRFYDYSQLYAHLSLEHFKCHVCQQSGLDNQYFKDYKSLERHFDRHHFLCHDVQCLTSRFVVFGSELDLRHHERTVHGGVSDASSKIQLEFRYRRTIESSVETPEESDFNYDLDGQAFVPSAPRPSQTGDTSSLSLHPLHVQRTASLRQQAQALRDAPGGQDVAFPTLQSDVRAEESAAAPGAVSQRLRLGWGEGVALRRVGQGQAGQVTEQDFPSLPSTQSNRPKSSAATNALGASKNRGVPSVTRQYAAVSAAASVPGGPAVAGGGAAFPILSSDRLTPVGDVPTSTPATDAVWNSTSTNQVSNLSAENFPSLGPAPSGSRLQYTAANAMTIKNVKPYSLASGTGQPSQPKRQSTLVSIDEPGLKSHQTPPSLNSATDFPPPPTSSKLTLTQASRSSAVAAAANVASSSSLTPLPSSGDAKTTVEDMKATLGASKYKQLKGFTRELVNGSLDAESYVDHAASLFDHGYADFDFWTFVPALLTSAPIDVSSRNRAGRYLEQLRKSTLTNKGASGDRSLESAASSTIATPKPSQWTSETSSRLTTAPPHSNVRLPSVAAAVRPPPTRFDRPVAATAKSKNAWGVDGSSVVLKAASKPDSVAVAAASPISTGSATAKEQKLAKHQKQQTPSAQGSNKSGRNKNQKNELRQLAFGS